MVTISHIVIKLVDERIYLHEAISKRIASFGSVAKRLKPDIEKELGREVEHTAIVTALRRYSDKIKRIRAGRRILFRKDEVDDLLKPVAE